MYMLDLVGDVRHVVFKLVLDLLNQCLIFIKITLKVFHFCHLTINNELHFVHFLHILFESTFHFFNVFLLFGSDFSDSILHDMEDVPVALVLMENRAIEF